MPGKQSTAEDIAMERGMPQNVEAERFILGSILVDLEGNHFLAASQALMAEDFVLEKHRRIFSRMAEIDERGERIDRVSLANELRKRGELESVDGLSYLVSLDDGMPVLSNIAGHIRIVVEKSLLRRIAYAAQHTLNQAMLGEDSPRAITAGAADALMKLGTDPAESGPRSPLQVIQGFPGGINSFLDPHKRVKGIATGFTRFDELTGGLRAGELIVLAARPSMGKTALALNIAWHAAAANHFVVVFSLEMSAESLLTRMLCAAGRIDSQRFRAGYMNEMERRKLRLAADEAMNLPILIDDTAALTMINLRARLTRIRQSGQKLGLVIVDYLQLMSSKGRSENRTQEVSQMSRGLKLLSKEFDCPFLVLSQLSRAPEQRTGDHRPQLSDLRESGSIEQDSDLVGFIFREEVYKRDREDLHGLAELILAKQRSGPIGKIDLVFLHAQTRFENRAGDFPDLPAEDAAQQPQRPYREPYAN